MANKTQHTIEIDAQIKTSLQGMDKAVKDFESQLKNSSIKIDMTKGIGKDLSKLISNFQSSFSKVESLIQPDNLLNLGDAKDFQKQGDSVIRTFKEIQRIATTMSTQELIDAKKLFPSAFDSRVGEMIKALSGIGDKFTQLANKNADLVKLNGEIANLKTELSDLDEKAKNVDALEEKFKQTQTAATEASEAVKVLRASLASTAQEKIKIDTSDTEKEIGNLSKDVQALLDKGVTKGKGQKGLFGGKGITEWTKVLKDKSSTSDQKAQAQSAIELLRQYNEQNAALIKQREILAGNARLAEILKSDPGLEDDKNLKEVDNIINGSKQATQALTAQKEAAKQAEQAQQDLNEAQGASDKKDVLTEQLNKKTQKVTELSAAIEALKTATDFSQIANELNKIEGIDNVTSEMLQDANTLAEIMAKLKGLDESAFKNLQQTLAKLEIVLPDATQDMRNFGIVLDETGGKAVDLDQKLGEIDSLKQRIVAFFGLTNAIELFKRAVQSSFDTVKELDAVMTETAVVTDFSISDMWEKLPEYSDAASDLGASIKDLYSATTLYYQQGLQTNAAMDVGIETMKMARIANIDATDATTAMTAALRGFNMEVNEMNAQRVNDVYSELAAITAADTSQIATAMGKTASIAASANMEFETTAALLAQIIETTQEAPETAGTAMKTIIARFTEVKKMFSEGQLTGEDTEGEVIDINKIDAALRSVGISLKDFLMGSKGIDDIFLELAEKWDSLDLATQRYIATTAAGSRQQSRFIAMMSNYDRTMELVTAANNSAGASQEQFDKTLESLDAKLQQLKNAWDQFVMGLANQEVLKAAVDALTWILETINKVIDALSGGNGLSKSIITLMAVIGALVGGKALFKKIFDSEIIKNFIKTMRETPKEIKTTFAQAGQNIRVEMKAAFDDTVSYAGEAGIKAGQKYQEGFETGKKAEQLDNLLDEDDLWEAEMEKMMEDSGYFSDSDKTPSIPSPAPAPVVPSESTPVLEQNIGPWQKFKQVLADTSVQGWQTKGIITSLIGTVANWGAAAIKAEDETNEWASGLEAAGTAATFAGSAMSLLAPILAQTTIALGPLVLALIVFIGLIAGLNQLAKNNSLEGRMEAAAEATNKAKEAAENAKAAYDELLGNKSEYTQLQETLDGLVAGTNEWKQALVDVNNQVLQLLKTYPELAEHISRGEDGQLVLDEEGWTELEGEREQAVYDSQQNYYAKQSDEVDLQIEGKTFTVSDNQADYYADEFFQNVQQARLRYQKSWGIYDTKGSFYWTESNAEEIYNKIVGVLEESPADEITLEELGLEGQLDLDESQLKKLVDYVSTKEAEIDALEVQRGLYAEEQLRLSGQQLNLNDKQMGMLGVVSQDYIDKVQEDLAEEILDDGITAEQKRQYANMKGYTYDEVADEFKDAEGNVIKVTNEMVASGIALTQALDNIAAEVGGIAGNFDGVEYDLLTNQGLGLTEDEIEFWSNEENLKKSFGFDESEDLAKYMGIEFETWDQAAYEEFLTMLQERVSANDQRFEEIRSNSYTQNAYDAITGAITNKNGSLNLAQAEALQQQIYDAQMAGMGNTLQSIYSEILGSEEITDEEIPKVLDKLLNIDPSNLTSVENALQNLVDQGIISAREVDSLVNTIADLAGVSRKVSFESMVKTLKTTEDLIEDIEGREDHERIFSTEDKEALVARGADVTQFVMTGADEWTYIGDGMGSLVDALNANTEALLGDTKETVMQEADAARAWQAGIENTNTWKVDDQTGVTAEEVFGMISSGEKSADSFSGEQLVAQMAAFGMSTEGLGSLTTQEQIDAATKIITEAYNKYGTSTQRDAIIAEEEGVNSQIAQLAMSGMTGQEIVSSTDYTDEEKQTSLDAKIFTEEGLQQELESSTEALEEQNKAWKNNSDVIKANIVDANTSKKKFDTLNETIEENSEVLSDSNKNTEAYQKALSNITKAAQEAFGNDEINEEFVEKHKELFQQLTEGGETGAKALQQIREAVIKETNMVGEKATAVEGILQGLDGLAFDVNGRADFSQLFTQLVNLMDSAEEAAALMSKLGYSVTWEQNGFTDMKVFNPETQEIEFVSVPNYTAVVTDSAGNSVNDYTPSGGGGGGGGGGSEEVWENPYDELYNLTRRINEELRERERIERRYDKLLERRQANASKLTDLSTQELEQLELEAELQRELIAGRQGQIAREVAENSDLGQYATISTNEYGEQILRIDWDAIDTVTDTEEGERIEEFISQLEEWSDEIEEANDTLNDIEDTVDEIRERGKDEYMDLEDQIKEALTQTYQNQIDKLSEINDSINDTNSRLLDAMQTSIDNQRKERENADAEEEIANKQRRLAYLQQDTSGANAMEILQLQKEIDEAQEDYTDTLIDQKISELQRQNDEAAQQRERQIELAQAQLDYYVESGRIWTEVYALMTSGLNESTGLVRGSKLEEILKESENFKGLSEIGKMEWLADLNTNVAQALSYLKVGRQLEALGVTSGQISFTTADGKTLTGTVDAEGNVTTSDGRTYSEVYQTSSGEYYTTENQADGKLPQTSTSAPAQTAPAPVEKTNPYGKASETVGIIAEGMTGQQVKSIQWALKEMGYDIGVEGIDGVYGWATKRAVTQFQTDFRREYPGETMGTPDGIVGPNTRNAFRIKKYKTGGLADFTGPAWLDGTKSKPEYILNAEQTRAFFQLVDVLSGLKSNSNTNTQNSGDNTYDIDINVESIGSDYDVEQLADTVKRLINEDARYRNNNAINLMR